GVVAILAEDQGENRGPVLALERAGADAGAQAFRGRGRELANPRLGGVNPAGRQIRSELELAVRFGGAHGLVLAREKRSLAEVDRTRAGRQEDRALDHQAVPGGL